MDTGEKGHRHGLLMHWGECTTEMRLPMWAVQVAWVVGPLAGILIYLQQG